MLTSAINTNGSGASRRRTDLRKAIGPKRPAGIRRTLRVPAGRRQGVGWRHWRPGPRIQTCLVHHGHEHHPERAGRSERSNGKQSEGVWLRNVTTFETFVLLGQNLPRSSFLSDSNGFRTADGQNQSFQRVLLSRARSERVFTQNGGVGRAWTSDGGVPCETGIWKQERGQTGTSCLRCRSLSTNVSMCASAWAFARL